MKFLLYKRYRDDVFLLPGTREELKLVEIYLSTITQGIKITVDNDFKDLSFLDTTIIKEADNDTFKLKTNVLFYSNIHTS